MSVIQVIDENKQFSPDIISYLNKVNLSKSGLTYHVIAVFGSQSTGKSTLLNALFGTEFGVMDVSARQQTTKGIWMGSMKHIDNDETPLLILDVEGTDGRERGEDQDFERKAALFALATSEVLIINMWEHQVGLYVGANMALLRTVFEVNLSLFQAGRGEYQRSRILFVIRDHMGLTKLETLAATLKDDLEKQWDALSKPENLQESKISDFFDLDFAALPHKVLQPAEFTAGVNQLRKQLDKSFKPEYHRNVPLDGWNMYAEQIWQQIEMNKDLDLPTHQILVARFRCEEIGAQAFNSFEEEINSLQLPFGDSSVVIPNFGKVLKKIRNSALKLYDETASRYHQTVYNEKRIEVLGHVDGVLTAYFGAQLSALKSEALSTFKRHLEAPQRYSETTSEVEDKDKAKSFASNSLNFKDRIAAAVSSARSQFEAAANEAVIDSSFFSYSTYLQELEVELLHASERAREIEFGRIIKRIRKVIASRLDPVDLHFAQFPKKLKNPWDAVQGTLETAISSVRSEYPDDLGLGGSSEETARYQLAIECAAWRELETRISALTKADTVLQKLRDRFEDTFKYSEDGLPIVWSPGDDIDAAAVRARQSALLLLPELSTAKLSNGKHLCPPPEITEFLHQKEDEVPDFIVLLTTQQQQEIERRFQRVADSAFVDAKRSVMQLQTHIPSYIFIIIAILGWNEFTMVLRNPLLILLVLILGGAAYVVHNIGLTNTVLNIAESTLESTIDAGKAYLRELLLKDNEKSSTTLKKQSIASSMASDDDEEVEVKLSASRN